MNILFCLHQFFPESHAGTEVLTLGLAKALEAQGHRAAIFAAKRGAPVSGLLPYEIEDYAVDGVPVRRVGRPREGLSRPLRLGYDDPRMAERLAEYLDEFRPDVVHFTHLQGLSAAAIDAVKARGLPAVYTATDFWTICPVVDLVRHDGLLCKGPDLAHCPRCLASRAAAASGSRVARLAKETPGFVFRAGGALSRLPLPEWRSAFPLRQARDVSERAGFVREIVNRLDRVISPTQLTRNLLVANGVNPEIIEISPYGIDTSGLTNDARPDVAQNTRGVRFGFVGTLGPHKGADLLIEAFGRLPQESDATLTVHGTDAGFEEYGASLRRMAEKDPRVRLAGGFPAEKLGEVLSGMDVLVVPSRWYENAPLVVYSAFAAGVPVVAADVGGLSEAVRHGENGLLFPLGSAGGLRLALRRLVEEPGLIHRLRDGIRPVKSLEENAEELLTLYNDLVRRNADSGGSGR